MNFRTHKFRYVATVGIFFSILLSSWGCASVQSAFGPSLQNVSISVTPNQASVKAAGTLQFTAAVSNTSDKTVTWHVNGVPGGDPVHGIIDATGKYKAPPTPPSPATISVMAVLSAHPDKAATATVVVLAPEIIVSVSPASAALQVGKTLALTAIVQNDSQNSGATWTMTGSGCTGAGCGTLSTNSSASNAAVIYTAPATVTTTISVTFTATSVADATKSANATITVTTAAPPPPDAAITVLVDPTATAVQSGKTQSLKAIVENDAKNGGVTWTLSGSGCSDTACGTLSATSSASGASITYTAPGTIPSPAAVMATATSVSDSSKSAATHITITAAPAAIVVTLSSTAGSVQTGKTGSITATVQNDSQNKGVTWKLTGSGCSSATCGTLSATSSASGTAITYTAPATAPSPATVTLTATSVANTSKTAATTITITTSAPPAISIAVSLTTASVQTGKTANITATVQNDSQNKGVTWKLTGSGCSGATCGNLSATSSASGTAITYTAPANVPSPASVTLTATSAADTSKTAAATITIATSAPPAISVTVNPTSASVQTGQTQSVTATVQNDSQNKGVSWTIVGIGCSGSACGTLSKSSSASGTAITYTAPASVPSSPAITLTAASVADSSKIAVTTITITGQSTGNVSVTISPKRVGLTTGQTQTFTATVSGASPTTVTWEVDGTTGGSSSVGTIGSDGTYRAPSSPGTHTVLARSAADGTVTASASVAITDLAAVATYHNNLSRDGVNSKEYALTTSTVNSATFGKRFACAVDAQVYAQPLWVANVSMSGGTHNVVIAATQHDTVYAFDADASPCQTLWTKSLLGSGETWVSKNDVNTDDIHPDIGIVGTPVIDTSTNTIYVVSKSKGDGFHQRLHALSLSDGSEKFSGPKEIAFTSNGITFDPLRQNERCGLALVNGTVYIAYASHGDNTTYYGWVLGYGASSLSLNTIFNDDPSSGYGGIWMSGGAPAADSNGNLYMITGNGDWDGTSQFGDSFLKLSGGTSVASYFTPSNESALNGSDQDLGAGGAAILIGSNLLIGGGKEGKLYLLNRDNMGGKTSGDTGPVQAFSVGNAIFATPAFYQNTLYLAPIQGHLKAYNFNSGTFSTSPSSQSGPSYGFPGATPSISAQGSSNGIVWTIDRNAVLRAFDATNLGTELWNSTMHGNDHAGPYVKFTVPTIANGKVYVGTGNEISVYGLSPN